MLNDSSKQSSGRRWLGWLLLLLVMILSLAVVFVPAWLIRPFTLQTEGQLRLSYALRQWGPIVTLAALAGALLIAVSLWSRSRRWWRKALLVLPFLPMIVSAWFARQNHFEWMFKPMASTAFSNLNEAGFVSEGDMVLGVELNGDAAAYPVRQVAYHHVVQDTIGGVPVAVTY